MSHYFLCSQNKDSINNRFIQLLISDFVVADFFPKTPSPKPARIPPQTPPAGGKSVEAGRIRNPRQIVSPCRVLFSSFNHLDFARNSFELCPINTAMNQVINLREKVKEKTPQPPARNKTETASFEADIKNTRPDHDSVNLISWEAPTFNYNPNKKYLALVIIFIFLGAGTLLFLKKDFLLVIFLVLYALMLIFYANKKPE